MVKCSNFLKKAWDKLTADYDAGEFNPQKEADIQFYLGHLMLNQGLNPNEIQFEHTPKKDSKSKIRCDIVIINGTHEKLFIEIKDKHVEQIKKIPLEWIKDLKKLKNWDINKKSTDRRPVLITFLYTKKANHQTIKILDSFKEKVRNEGIEYYSYPKTR